MNLEISPSIGKQPIDSIKEPAGESLIVHMPVKASNPKKEYPPHLISLQKQICLVRAGSLLFQAIQIFNVPYSGVYAYKRFCIGDNIVGSILTTSATLSLTCGILFTRWMFSDWEKKIARKINDETGVKHNRTRCDKFIFGDC